MLKATVPAVKPPVDRESSIVHEADSEPPGVPGFRSWRGIYAFVFGAFILLVIVLAIITRVYA